MNIKNEKLVYISKGICCSQMLVFTLNLDSRNYCVHRCWFSPYSGFTKILCTPIFPLYLDLCHSTDILNF